jgi:hypothetical protein
LPARRVRHRGILPVSCGFFCAVALTALPLGGCAQKQELPDAGFVYLSRADVDTAVATLAVPLAATDPSARAAESCACELWGGQPEVIFTSPVIPGATIALVGDSVCAGQSIRRRGTIRLAVTMDGETEPCVALDVMRDSLIVVTDTGRSSRAARQYLQAALLYIVAWAPDLLDNLAVIASTADVAAVMRGRPDTAASVLGGRLWAPRDPSDIWGDSLTVAAGSAGPPWFSTTGDPVKIIIATVHKARDGKVQLAPFSFVFKHGRIREVKSIFDPDYEPPPPDILKNLQ